MFVLCKMLLSRARAASSRSERILTRLFPSCHQHNVITPFRCNCNPRPLFLSTAAPSDSGRPKNVEKLLRRRYQKPPTLPRLEPESNESRKTKLRKKYFFSFLNYLGNYEKIIEAIVPKKLIEASRVMINGTKLIATDMREFAWAYKVLSTTSDWQKAAGTLSRRHLELYMNLPAELYRVAPVLVVSAFPLMQNVAFPLALMFPKRLLSSHYWSDELKAEVMSETVQRRHKYYRSVFRYLQRGLEAHKGKPLYQSCLVVLRKLAVEGEHPPEQDILALRPLFSKGGVFSLAKVNRLQLRHLMRTNGRYNRLWWRYDLREHANLLMEIDRAVVRENMEALSHEELQRSCSQRGLNVHGLDRSEMLEYLGAWTRISGQLDAGSASLLLHLPVLLGYNHRTRHCDSTSV